MKNGAALFFCVDAGVIMNEVLINMLECALDEDLGTAGDITSFAIFEEGDVGRALISAKQAGVLSGITLIKPLFELVDARLSAAPAVSKASTRAEVCLDDGDILEPGVVICRIEGPVRSILSGERVILNLLQRLSGIATATAAMVEALKGTNTRLLDTRKTSPGLRLLEKAAVRHGGGANHRIGLYDMILIKDTHIKRCGGIVPALTKAFAWRGGSATPQIEVEVQSTGEFMEALALGPERIMLDNMSLSDMEFCVGQRNVSGQNIALEASGGISISTLPGIAATGVDFVSSGAITHSAPALDIHLVMV